MTDSPKIKLLPQATSSAGGFFYFCTKDEQLAADTITIQMTVLLGGT
jgi:hypothetical protein